VTKVARQSSRPNLSEYLTGEILEFIRSRGLKPGMRLPSVKKMSEMFSVAAPTLREALRRLEVTGIVEIKHGAGIYVGKNAERVILTNPYKLNLTARSFLEVIDARVLVEPHLAGLAAKNASDEDIDKLKRLLLEASQHLSGSKDDNAALNHANVQFHRAIAAASNHTVFSQLIESLMEIFSYEQLLLLYVGENYHQDYEEHQTIFEAIFARDSKQSQLYMHQHLKRVQLEVEHLIERHEFDDLSPVVKESR
jgi:GntR family transcriptional regulator, transcriptional repressor for pyruvate dehydrogenase complex